MDNGPKVFISYRRDDSAGYAGGLARDMRQCFGADQVFYDQESIKPGAEFPRRIREALGECRALLAVIGPRWLTLQDEGGRRRLDLEDDYVRLEIATALEQGLLVIPVRRRVCAETAAAPPGTARLAGGGAGRGPALGGPGRGGAASG